MDLVVSICPSICPSVRALLAELFDLYPERGNYRQVWGKTQLLGLVQRVPLCVCYEGD